MVLELESTLFGKAIRIRVDQDLAYFAGLAYGDGYAEYGEVRVVTMNEDFLGRILPIVKRIAEKEGASHRVYSRPGNISDNLQRTLVLNSTAIRRLLFGESRYPDYGTVHAIAMEPELAPYFQAGLTDAEGSLVPPQPVEYPHGRVFAAANNDRRLLGIARLSLVYCLRLEPSSVKTRLSSKRGREHVVRGVKLATRKNNYVLEVCSGAKRKWIASVGMLLQHPKKAEIAQVISASYRDTSPQ